MNASIRKFLKEEDGVTALECGLLPATNRADISQAAVLAVLLREGS